MSESNEIIFQNDKIYAYLSLTVQALTMLTVLSIAILRFINTRSQLKINNLKDVYFKAKNKRLSESDSV